MSYTSLYASSLGSTSEEVFVLSFGMDFRKTPAYLGSWPAGHSELQAVSIDTQLARII